MSTSPASDPTNDDVHEMVLYTMLSTHPPLNGSAQAVAGNFGTRIGSMLARVMKHPGVAAAVKKALAAGVPWLQILMTILPFVLDIFAGKPIDFQAIIAAIMELFK